MRHIRYSGICAALAALAAAAPAMAQSPAEFFKGKQISYIIGYNPGGTYDIYSRIVIPHLSRHIPGQPTIVARNMPGVASLKAASFLANQAPRDGTAIGMISQAVALEQVLKNPAVDFDVRALGWLGRLASVVETTVAWHTSPVKTLKDAQTMELIIGATSARSTSDSMPKLMNSLGGAKFNVVLGYQGTTGAMLAMERGEVQGSHATVENLLLGKPDWVKDKKISILVQYSQRRHPAFPDVPAMVEVAKSSDDRQLLALYGSTAEIGRAIMTPPGLPKDRLAALQKAFSDMAKDTAFVAEVEKRKMEFDPMSGEDLFKLIQETLNVSPAVAARAAAARE